MVTQNRLTHEHKLRLRWFIALSTLPLLGVVSAFGIIPQDEISFTFNQKVIEEISLPENTSSQTAQQIFWHSERIQRGDTIDELLRRLGVDDSAANQYLRQFRQPGSLQQLPAGKHIQAATLQDGSLVSLRYYSTSGKQIIIEKKGDQFVTRSVSPSLEKRTIIKTGEISSSLFAATDSAGISDSAAVQLADIFSGDIDFHRDLRKGDRFSVIYEMSFSNGEPVSTGKILAAEFINQGHSYRALYYETVAGHGNYFSPEGKNMRKAFLRSPLEFSRISSGFTLSRFHPILQKWSSHKGVDYAAATGTKVKATSDGIVEFAGKQAGYGNVVILRHSGRYSTLYGHLSRFANGLHRGQKIFQGDIIGYVGQTGLATGPHLHYEFMLDGIHRNPVSVTLPEARPINQAQKEAFKSATAAINDQLNMLSVSSLAKAN